MYGDSLRFQIDWTLDQVRFRSQVRRMVKLCRDGGKVITLPLFPECGDWAIELLSVILSQVNCDGCDAPCCKFNPQGGNLSLLPSEYQRLKNKYGETHLLNQEDQYYIKMPCGFLRDNRCTIYPDRPLVCVMYPFNPGGTEGLHHRMALSLESRCPEAQRLAKAIYMTSWKIRQIYWSTGAEDFVKVIENRRESAQG